MNEKTELVAPLAALINTAEIDQQIQTAKKYPRSVKAFLDEAREMVTLTEQVAGECIYAIPRSGKMIEGPSARFAEVVLSAWGNSRAGARIVNEEKKFITAQGVYQDLERNTAITYEVRRRITSKSGSRFNDDMIGVTGNAAASIALRNAILKGVPKAFWATLYDEARKTAMGDAKTLATRRADAVSYLGRYGVTAEQICVVLGVQGIEDISLDHLVKLRAMATSIKDGEATVESLFSGDSEEMERPRQTVADLKRGDQASIAVEELEKEVEAELEKPTDEKTGVPWFDEEEQKNVEREKGKSVDQTEPATEEWPMKDAEGRIVDSKGTVFDSAIHGTSSSGVPARTKNNVFRKRRGVQVVGGIIHTGISLPEPGGADLTGPLTGPVQPAEPVPADESDQSEPPKIDTQVIRDMLRQASSNEEIDEITEVIAKIDHPAEQYVLNQFAAARREQINRE